VGTVIILAGTFLVAVSLVLLIRRFDPEA